MFMRRVAIATASLATIACAGAQLPSPPSTWSADFTDRSPPTAECPGGSLAHLGNLMSVSKPTKLAEFKPGIPEAIRSRISSDDTLHSFQFNTTAESGDYWGFSGYLVARADCIIHAQVTGYDN